MSTEKIIYEDQFPSNINSTFNQWAAASSHCDVRNVPCPILQSTNWMELNSSVTMAYTRRKQINCANVPEAIKTQSGVPQTGIVVAIVVGEEGWVEGLMVVRDEVPWSPSFPVVAFMVTCQTYRAMKTIATTKTINKITTRTFSFLERFLPKEMVSVSPPFSIRTPSPESIFLMYFAWDMLQQCTYIAVA